MEKTKQTLTQKLGNFLEEKRRVRMETRELNEIINQDGVYKVDGVYLIQKDAEKYALVQTKEKGRLFKKKGKGMVLVNRERGEVIGETEHCKDGWETVPYGVTVYTNERRANALYLNVSPKNDYGERRGILIGKDMQMRNSE